MTENSVQPELQLRDFMRILKRRKWIVISCVVLCVAGAAALALLSQPTYRCIARILVDARGPQDTIRLDDDPVNQVSLPNAAPDIESQIGILQSPTVLKGVFDRAGVPFPNPDDLEDRVISAKQVGASNIVDIAVNLESGNDAFKVASEIPKAYGEYMSSNRQGQMNKAVDFQQTKLASEKAELEKANATLIKFVNDQQSKGAPVAGTDSRTAGEQYEFRLRTAQNLLDDGNARLQAARERLGAAEIALNTLKRTNPWRTDPATISTSQELLLLQRNVAELRGQYEAIRTIKSDDNPDVIAAKTNLQIQEKYLKNFKPTIPAFTKVRNPDLDIYQEKIDEAKIDLEGQQAAVASYATSVQREQRYLDDYNANALKREQLQRESDLHLQAVADISRQLNLLSLRNQAVKDPLTPLLISTPEQVSPRIVRTLIVGFFLGLVLGVAAALIRDRTDDKLYTLDQIQESCGVLALGRVPQAEHVLALVPGTERGQSTALESYRSLRFSLDSNKEGFAESIVLTSATAAEGRAEMAYNVAVESARDLRRAILVDADMRKPALHSVVGVPATPGLSDYLMGKATVDEILHSTMNNYLSFVPAGSPVENPLQLLTSPAMATLNEELQKRCDAIIFNSPSLLRYADGRAIAKIATAAILVAKRGVSKRGAIRYCAEMLRRTNTRLLGVVLNDTAGGASDVPYFYSSEEASA